MIRVWTFIVFAAAVSSDNTEMDNPFLDLVDSEFYVDKTEFIKFFHKYSIPVYFTAPQCFGKTVNMHTLKSFYEVNFYANGSRAKNEDTRNYKAFRTLKEKKGINPTILEDVSFFESNFGRSPVIHLSFKTIRADSYENFVDSLYLILQRAAYHYWPALKNFVRDDKVLGSFASKLEQILTFPKVDSKKFLAINGGKILSKCLQVIFQAPCLVLIDDFDGPVLNVLTQKDMSQFKKIFDSLQEFVSNLVKDNESVNRTFLTGNLRLTGGFSPEANNIEHFSFILNPNFTAFFGLGQLEVEHLIKDKPNLSLEKIGSYYGGYKLLQGTKDTRVYNPHSMRKYLETNVLAPYWSAAGSDGFLNRLFNQTCVRDVMDLAIRKVPITMTYNEGQKLDFAEILGLHNIFQFGKAENTSGSEYMKRFLYELGFFTVVKITGDSCALEIPNEEITVTIRKFLNK